MEALLSKLIFKLKPVLNKIHTQYAKIRYITRNRKYSKKLQKILVLYYIPECTLKEANWRDGFVSAIELLDKKHEITWINISKHKPKVELLNEFDFIINKSMSFS